MDGPSAFDNFRGRITELEQSLAASEARGENHRAAIEDLRIDLETIRSASLAANGALQDQLRASEARVVELERHRDMLKELLAEANAQHFDATMRAEAAESAASTAMRDGMMEAARIAQDEANDCAKEQSLLMGWAAASNIVSRIRARASSLPGGEGKAGDDDPYRPEMVEELLSLVGTPAGRETRKDGEG